MKKMFMIIVAGFTSLISCKKDSSSSTVTTEISVRGAWSLFAAGSLFAPQPPIEKTVLNFEDASNYRIHVDTATTEKGIYNLQLKENNNKTETYINFIPDSGDEHSAYATRSNDTLLLYPLVVSTDGYIEEYKKRN